MTVKELIAKLQMCDEEKIVRIEGCDCTGKADDVDKDDSAFSILITRR